MSSTSATKNFFKYVGIFLGICLAVVLVVLGVMVLFKVEIFGYKYVKITANDKDSIIVTASTQGFEQCPTTWPEKLELIDRVTIKADNIDVIIKPWVSGKDDKVGQYTIIPNINASGFAKVSERGSLLKMDVKLNKYTPEGQEDHFEIIVDVSCPSGLLSYNSSNIVVQTPFLTEDIFNYEKDGEKYYDNEGIYQFGSNKTINIFPFDTEAYDDISTNDKEDLVIQRINTLHLQHLNIETTSGDISVQDGLKGINNEITVRGLIYADKITAKTTSGNISLHRCGLTNLDASTDTGDMRFSQLTNYTIPGEVVLTSNTGKIIFEKGINLGYGNQNYKSKSNVTINGKLNQVELNSLLNTNVTYNGDADNIKIDSILFSGVEIGSRNAHLKIGSIYSDASIHLSYNAEEAKANNNSGYRTITIDYAECNDNFGLSTWSGDITINTLVNTNTNDNATTIITESGNITINELIGNTDLYTKSGNITVKQRNAYDSGKPEDIQELATFIANKRYGQNLKAKQQLLNECQDLVLDAKKNGDKEYENDLENRIALVQKQINDIQAKIDAIKGENYCEEYTTRQRVNSHIVTSTISGTVKLENLITYKLDANVRENGSTNMYIQFNEILNANSIINITSGRGNTYLYTPIDSELSYWVYAKKGSVKTSSTNFFKGEELAQGYCRIAQVLEGYPDLNNAIKVKESSDDTTEGAKTIEDIKFMCNTGFITINSEGGDTIINTTGAYQIQ